MSSARDHREKITHESLLLERGTLSRAVPAPQAANIGFALCDPVSIFLN
ncbi:MAG: hypothetical protein MI807_18080 [Verrucomicrobiales bacterium]|nr:hypothetical protein [Verrucomicrobiales bacterium]